MRDEQDGREQKMLSAVKEHIVLYWNDNIQDYETIVVAASEILQDKFGIKPGVADNMARKYVDDVWDEAMAQADYEAEDTTESDREYYKARMGAY